MLEQSARLEGDGLTVVTDQRSRGAILAGLAQMRLEGAGPADRPGLGRWALSIPELDWLALTRANPALVSRDLAEQQRAMRAFIASPESIPYRMRERV